MGLAETAIDFAKFQKEFVDWADVVVIQRVLGKSIKHLIHYCHMTGKKIVFELDDNVWNFPDSPEYKNDQAKEIPGQTSDILQQCDAVTVSTDTIAQSAKENIDKPVFVLPNCLDFSKWRKMDITHNHFLVGWMGGHYHVQDLEMIVDPLKEVLKKNDKLTLVFLGCCPMQLLMDYPSRVFLQEFVNIELLPKTMAVMHFNIGLAPLFATEFAKSRSNIRLLQYSALEIPSIVSYWGEYAKMIDSGFPGFCVKDGKWEKAVQEMIDDENMRTTIGKKAYEYVVEKYDIKKNITRWMEVYESL